MSLILDVARGLNYLHTHNPPVIHGDLKGNNVLITDEGRAVLSDFGLSQVLDDLGHPTGFTLSHPDAGPLRWQAPEFMEEDDLIPAQLSGDIWSFGCTAYEFLTGNFPYAHRNRDGLVFKDMREGIKPWGPIGMEVKSERDCKMRDLLDSCWCFCPEQRPTMAEVIVQLENICSET
ncbi:kinase-like domain-containing protein [Cyathus striatus]|nr:kinase-like domain-containing protein [Cyathus striatus]